MIMANVAVLYRLDPENVYYNRLHRILCGASNIGRRFDGRDHFVELSNMFVDKEKRKSYLEHINKDLCSHTASIKEIHDNNERARKEVIKFVKKEISKQRQKR